MRLKVSASTDRYTNLPWPDGIPLPPAGSYVVMTHDGEQVTFVVDRCEFDFTDPSSGAGTVCVRGHHYVPGSV
jgi:hypothetical protein